MGKLGGFLEINREDIPKREVEERVKDYKELYDIKASEVKQMKIHNLFRDVLIIGTGAYAFSQLDDNSDRAIVGGLTLFTISFDKW